MPPSAGSVAADNGQEVGSVQEGPFPTHMKVIFTSSVVFDRSKDGAILGDMLTDVLLYLSF